VLIPSTLAEFAVAAAVVWGIYRLLSPLRLRIQRALLRWLDPSKAGIVDAEIVPQQRKDAKE
jgi:hypothetical protein